MIRPMIVAAGMAALLVITAASRSRAPAPATWEYRTVWDETDTAKLNALGREGLGARRRQYRLAPGDDGEGSGLAVLQAPAAVTLIIKSEMSSAAGAAFVQWGRRSL